MPGACSGRLERVLEGLLVYWVCALGAWTLYAHALVFGGASFRTLAYGSPLPLLASLLVWAWLRAEGPRRAGGGETPTAGSPSVVSLLAPAALAALFHWQGFGLLFWSASTAYAFAILLAHGRREGRGAERGRPEAEECRWATSSVATLSLACAVAALVLVTHRGTGDHSLYLSFAVSSLDAPELPLLRYDGLHGESGLPLLLTIYRVHTYELLVALLSKLSTCGPAFVYFFVLPAVSGFVLVLAHRHALRELGGERAPLLVGLAASLLVLACWGDGERTYGNLAFASLALGKGVLAAVAVPTICGCAARFSRRRDLRSWALLALSQVAAVGLSGSGLLVGPVSAGLVLAGACRLAREDARMLASGFAACLYPLAIAVGVGVAGRGELLSAWAADHILTLGPEALLGEGWRARLAIFALLSLPLVPTSAARRRLLCGYVLAVMLFVLNPLTPLILDRVARFSRWRILWAVPFPVLIALFAMRLAAVSRSVPGWRLGGVVAALLLAGFAAAPGRWVLSEANQVVIRSPALAYKLGGRYDVAQFLVQTTPPDGLVLAPTSVALWLPTLEGHPRVVAVRSEYLSLIARARGLEEAEERYTLLRVVNGVAGSEEELGGFGPALERRGVDTVVVPLSNPLRPSIGQTLVELGFSRTVLPGFELWTRR
jgi:hypothetical protein